MQFPVDAGDILCNCTKYFDDGTATVNALHFHCNDTTVGTKATLLAGEFMDVPHVGVIEFLADDARRRLSQEVDRRLSDAMPDDAEEYVAVAVGIAHSCGDNGMLLIGARPLIGCIHYLQTIGIGYQSSRGNSVLCEDCGEALFAVSAAPRAPPARRAANNQAKLRVTRAPTGLDLRAATCTAQEKAR